MILVRAPVCMQCKHYRWDSEIISCNAFPKGIPAIVIRKGNKHKEPLPGDHGIQFEEKD